MTKEKPAGVTARDLAQTAENLSTERNLYKDLANTLPAGVYRLHIKAAKVWVNNEWVTRLGTNYSIAMANDAFCRILGITQAQRAADTTIVAERIHPDDRPDFIAKNVEALNCPGMFRWAGRILRGKEVRWVQFTSVPRILANGDMIWTGILQDHTESKKAAAVLRESEERYRSLFEQAGDCIVVFDQGTTAMLDFNDMACLRMGYTREEFSKLKLTDLEAAETCSQTRRHVRHIATKGERLFETKLRTKSGEVLDFEVRPKALVIGGKTVIQAIWHDITDRKRAEDLLRKSNDDLEAKVKERTRILQALAAELTQAEHRERERIAHILHEDLQQRLVGIQYKLHSLKEAESESSTTKALNRTIEELAETVQLTRELATHISPPVLSELGLRAALDWLVKHVQAKCDLHVRICGRKPVELASHGLRDFTFDAIRELLLNICKHADVRSAEIQLRPAGRHHIAIKVRDEGKGGAEIQKNQSSFGLLSIRERAYALGVGFEIDSCPGKGTCVTLTLPTR
jgi:PAS domain S-box-containing protein